MVDNETLKTRLKKELNQLGISEEQQELMVKELNYLSDLLIDVYLEETKNGR